MSESVVDKGFTWAYCYLCEGLELICPKCKKSSCCGGGCDFCIETFREFSGGGTLEGRREFIQKHALEIPDSIPVIGRGIEKLIEESRKAENG